MQSQRLPMPVAVIAACSLTAFGAQVDVLQEGCREVRGHEAGQRPSSAGNPGSCGVPACTVPPDYQEPPPHAWEYWWGFNREAYLRTAGEAWSMNPLRPSTEKVLTTVVPALIRSIESETSVDIVAGSLMALAKAGRAVSTDAGATARIAQTIARRLDSAQVELQELAALALGILGDERQARILGELVRSDLEPLRARGLAIDARVPERTRAFAAYGLGLLASQSSEDIRAAIACELMADLEGERAAPSADLAVACVTALGLCPAYPRSPGSRREQVTWLLDLFDDPTLAPVVRAHVPTAIARLLAGLGDAEGLREDIVRRWMSDLNHPQSAPIELQQSVVLALGELVDGDQTGIDSAARRLLARVAETSLDEQLRCFARVALACAASRPGGGGLEDLVAAREEARRVLLTGLRTGDGSVRQWSALCLGLFERRVQDAGLPQAAGIALEMRDTLSRARDPRDVGALSIGLGLARDFEGREVLRRKSSRVSDPEARGYLAVALGLLQDRDSIEPLKKVMRKSRYQPELFKSTCVALALLGAKETSSELVDLLREATSLSTQAAITTGLGFLGDTRSIEVLISCLQDPDRTDRARGFAAVALGQICEPGDLSWSSRLSLGVNYRARTATLCDPVAGTGVLDIY